MKPWVSIALMFMIVGTILFPCSLQAADQTGSIPALIVLNKSEHTADLFRLDTRKRMAHFPTDPAPHEATVTRDGKLAVIANYGTADAPGHTLTVIDLIRKTVTRTIDLHTYQRPHGLASLSNGHVLVTCEAQKVVVEVDPKTGKVVRAIPTRGDTSHMVTVSPDESHAYVANIRSGSISSLDLNRGAFLKTVATGKGSEGMTLTHHGRYLWVTNRAENTLVRMETKTGEITHRLTTCEMPIRVKGTPDDRFVLISCARSGDLMLVDASTVKEIKRQHVGHVPIGIIMHPRKNLAFVALSEAQRVIAVTIPDLEQAFSLSTGKTPDGMAWVELKSDATNP